MFLKQFFCLRTDVRPIIRENSGHVRAVTKATLITKENGESPSTALRDNFDRPV